MTSTTAGGHLFTGVQDTDKDEWLKLRSTRISGSTAASILCVEDAFETPLKVWTRLTGREEEPDEDEPDNPYFEYGHEMENAIAKWWEKRKKLILLPSPGLIIHKELDWLCGTPDRMVECTGNVWEGKAVSPFIAHKWDDGPPDKYKVQALIYMELMGVDRCEFGAMIPPFLHTPTLEFDRKVVDTMLNYLSDWYHDHVEKDVPPAADVGDGKLLRKLMPQVENKRIVLKGEDKGLAEQWLELKDGIKEMTKESEKIKAHIQQVMDGATYAVINDEHMFSWKKTFLKVKYKEEEGEA